MQTEKFITLLKKILLFGSAGMFILIGVIGILLPLMPGAPLILIGLALALRDNEKRERWKQNSKIYQYIKRELEYIKSKTF